MPLESYGNGCLSQYTITYCRKKLNMHSIIGKHESYHIIIIYVNKQTKIRFICTSNTIMNEENMKTTKCVEPMLEKQMKAFSYLAKPQENLGR